MADTSTITTLDQFKLSFPIRLLNRFGRWLEVLHLKTASINADSLIAQATRQTGLSDWGDSAFLDDYRVLIQNFERADGLSLLGRLAMRQEFLRILTNRLRHVELIKQHPEILDVPIQRPIFILGLPRTGTTLLHKLFAQDASMRVPLFWQLLSPFPLTADEREIQQRIRLADNTVKLSRFVAPLFRVIHQADAREPEECIFLLPHHLAYHGRGIIPNYIQWYLSRSAISDYRYYKQQLQILQWQQSVQHWVVKSPFHLFNLDVLLEVFPDACIIQTHRDPTKVLPSWCSLSATFAIMHRDHVDYEEIGRDWLQLWRTAMDRTIAVRETANAEQFFDLHYDQFVADPVAMMRRIYQYFGYPLSEAAEAGIRRWVVEQPADKYGVHRYDAAQFGLNDTVIRETFKPYIERFGIRLE